MDQASSALRVQSGGRARIVRPPPAQQWQGLCMICSVRTCPLQQPGCRGVLGAAHGEKTSLSRMGQRQHAGHSDGIDAVSKTRHATAGAAGALVRTTPRPPRALPPPGPRPPATPANGVTSFMLSERAERGRRASAPSEGAEWNERAGPVFRQEFGSQLLGLSLRLRQLAGCVLLRQRQGAGAGVHLPGRSALVVAG